MFDAIKSKVNTLIGVLVLVVALQAVTIGGLGYFAYEANARANGAVAALQTSMRAVRSDVAAAKTASETARDYGRLSSALGLRCNEQGARRR